MGIDADRKEGSETIASSNNNVVSYLVDCVVVTANLHDHIAGRNDEEASEDEVKDYEERLIEPVEELAVHDATFSASARGSSEVIG